MERQQAKPNEKLITDVMRSPLNLPWNRESLPSISSELSQVNIRDVTRWLSLGKVTLRSLGMGEKGHDHTENVQLTPQDKSFRVWAARA